jgi:hypothetical protein
MFMKLNEYKIMEHELVEDDSHFYKKRKRNNKY